MNSFVWVLYHNQEISWVCATFIMYKILQEYFKERENV